MARAKLGLWSMLLAGVMASQTAGATVTLMEKDGWAAKVSGFVEFDMIWDTTRAYTETQGNATIPLNTSVDGSYGRGQFSLRNSRLAIGVEAPEACGFKTKGYIEGDFLGYDPSPAAQSEASFYNNPTFRLRHAYLAADNGSVSILAGQYWSLFGMQPNYFMPTEQVQPVAAMLYLRVPQLRMTGNMNITDTVKLNLAVSAQRPPQRDSLIPDFQGGVRFTLDSWKALYANGSSAAITEMPTSLSVSALVRDFLVPTPTTASPNAPLTGQVGWAIAANGFVPVCKHLAFTGEFSYGYGYGDQYNTWTGGLANPGTVFTGNSVTTSLDGGIGGFDSAGNFKLVNLVVWNVAAQWHMPDWHTYFSAGAGQLYSPNVLAAAAPGVIAGSYNRSLVIFGNIVHNFTDQIRSGIEYAYSETGYTNATLGQNHRVQSTTSFIW